MAVQYSKQAPAEALFQRVADAHGGQLDVLVNNAYGAVNAIMTTGKQKFWEKPLWVWDASHNVGLRSHYVCASFAAKLMVPRRSGLIVNISSFGGLRYAGASCTRPRAPPRSRHVHDPRPLFPLLAPDHRGWWPALLSPATQTSRTMSHTELARPV